MKCLVVGKEDMGQKVVRALDKLKQPEGQMFDEDPTKYEVQLTDTVPIYDCQNCVRYCCFTPPIFVNPYDVWRIVHSQEAKKMGFTWTHELFTPSSLNGNKPLIQVFNGANSHVPIAVLVPYKHNNLEGCPFNAPGCEPNETPLRCRCLLGEAQPIICKAFPLGRFFMQTIEKGKAPRIDEIPVPNRYLHLPNQQCKATGATITVKQALDQIGAFECYKEADKVTQLYNEMIKLKLDLSIRYVLGQSLFDFDFFFLLQHLLQKNKGLEHLQLDLILEMRPKTFDEVLENARKGIEVFTSKEFMKMYAQIQRNIQ